MTTLYFVRHAEAEGNMYRRAQGWTDGRLTPNGRAQLSPLAARFAKIPLDAVYASDLTRAYETARAVADAQGLPVTPLRALREISLGDWEDRPWALTVREGGEDYRLFSEGALDFTIPNGENGRQVRARITGAITEIARGHDGETVCVVSHGAALQYFLGQFGDVTHWGLDNTSVSLCRYENGVFTLVYAGDNAHTGELSTAAKLKIPRDGKLVSRTELWFRPVRLPEEREALTGAGLAAWYDVYHTRDNFDREVFLLNCAEAAAAEPRYVQFVMRDETPVGLFHLKDNGRLAAGDGHIALIWLEESLCGQGLGAQLLGEAINIFRPLGRTHLALRVWEKNYRARVFYAKHGFIEQSRENGAFETLIVMRREI